MNNVNKVIALSAVIISFATVLPMKKKKPMFPGWYHVASVKEMNRYCNSEYKGDIGRSKCREDYSKQLEHFIVIAATNKCQGNNNLNLEKFKYVAPQGDLLRRFNNTKAISSAYEQWENVKVRECAKKLLRVEDEFIQRELLRPKLAELEQFEKEHPILTSTIKFQKWVKSFWDNGD